MGGNSSKKQKLEKEKQEQERIRLEQEREKNEREKKRIEDERNELKKPIAPTFCSAARAYLARRDYDKLKQIVARRANIAKEIFETEKSYCNSLNVCIEYFNRPLEKAAQNVQSKVTRPNAKKRKQTQQIPKTKEDIADKYLEKSHSSFVDEEAPIMVNPKAIVPDLKEITQLDVKAIFSQIEVILKYNDEFLKQLESRVSAWEWRQQLGDLFLGMIDFLKIYIQFVNNYNTSMDKIAYLKEKEPEFIPWIEKTKMIPEVKNMDLLSYLIMPIQRTPRYVMLLEDLVKHSPDDHIDNKNLSEALKKMKEVAALINEKKAEVENFKMLVDLYGKLEPVLESLCEPHRRFVF